MRAGARHREAGLEGQAAQRGADLVAAHIESVLRQTQITQHVGAYEADIAGDRAVGENAAGAAGAVEAAIGEQLAGDEGAGLLTGKNLLGGCGRRGQKGEKGEHAENSHRRSVPNDSAQGWADRGVACQELAKPVTHSIQAGGRRTIISEMPRMSRHPVLFLSRCGAIDGLQRQLLYLATGLDRQRFPLTVAVNEPGPLRDELLGRGIPTPVYRMSPWRSHFHIGIRYLDAYRLQVRARAEGAGLVHAHDVWRAEYARFIARRLRIPYVVHVRGPLSLRDIHKHRLGLADAVICIAQRYVDDLISAGLDAKRVLLIDDAVDLTLFAPAQVNVDFLRSNLNIEGELLIGLVGRVTPDKRIREFLEIVAMLPSATNPPARFLIIGEWENPDYRREIENTVARLRLGPRVRFLERFDSQDMPKILSGLDLLVTLAGGSVMFEAMAMGTPVLSVRADERHSKHTVHDRTAWCVTTDQHAPVADALAHLLGDPALRRRLGEAGRAQVNQHLSSAAMIAKTEALYESLLTR